MGLHFVCFLLFDGIGLELKCISSSSAATAVMVNNISPTAGSLSIIIVRVAISLILHIISEIIFGVTKSMSELVKTSMEAIAPAFVNSTFAYSIKHNIAGGYLTYIIMVSLSKQWVLLM